LHLARRHFEQRSGDEGLADDLPDGRVVDGAEREEFGALRRDGADAEGVDRLAADGRAVVVRQRELLEQTARDVALLELLEIDVAPGCVGVPSPVFGQREVAGGAQGDLDDLVAVARYA